MLKDSLNFNTPEEGRAKIRELRELQSHMVGTLYPEVLEDEIVQIEHKINEMLYGSEVQFPEPIPIKDEPSDSIDWEQRRYEIAKDSMIGIMSNPELYKQIYAKKLKLVAMLFLMHLLRHLLYLLIH